MLNDRVTLEEVLSSIQDLHFSPCFCISFKKDKLLKQEFFTLSDKEKCYARVRELRSDSYIKLLSCIFHTHMEVNKL